MRPTYDRWQPYLLSILRIIAGFLFIQHGVQKIFGELGAPNGPAPLYGQIWLAGILELVGGAMLIVGFLTRPVAFVLSGLMAVAYFQAHAPQGFWTVMNKGELAVLYCFLFLYFVASGAGAWSLDALIWREGKKLGTREPLSPRPH